jgi:hypothetical protein
MRTLNLTAIANVTLDGEGNGIAQAGPANTNEVWLPASVSINCGGSLTGITGTPTCSIYAGAYIGPGTFVDGTYLVLQAASSLIQGQSVYVGQQIFAVWTNAPANAQATMVINGTRTVP